VPAQSNDDSVTKPGSGFRP